MLSPLPIDPHLPAIVRAVTERGEGIQAGAAVLVGSVEARIVEVVEGLLRDDARRASMSEAGRGVYGDGRAAARIAEVLAGDLLRDVAAIGAGIRTA